MANKIKEFDQLMDDMLSVAEHLDNHSVAYGFPTRKQSANDPKLTVAQVAYFAESGAKDEKGQWVRQPRKFLTYAEMLAEDKGVEHLVLMTDAFMSGSLYKTKRGLKLIAEDLGDTVREAILADVYAPLKASTIARKGSSDVLIETGDMYDSAEGKVVQDKSLKIGGD